MPQPQLSEQEAQAFGAWLRTKNIVPVPRGQEAIYGRAVLDNNPGLYEQFKAETQPGQVLAPSGSPVAQVGGALGRAAGAVGQALLTPIGPQGATTPTGPGPGVQPRGGLLPGYEPNIPLPGPSTGMGVGPTVPIEEELTKQFRDLISSGKYREAADFIIQYDAELGYSPVEALALAKHYTNLAEGGSGAGAGGAGGDNTAAYLARQSAIEQLAEQRRQFGITSEQQAARDREAIENEKNRVRQAIADLQMQGVGTMGTAYNQALSMYERAARAAVPAGATHVPGYEPGGSMAKLYGFSGIPFQPQIVAQGTTPFNAFQAMPQVESGIAAAIARAMQGGG